MILNEKNTKIIVVTHKQYNLIPNDPIYLPVHVGSSLSGKDLYQGDDIGDNISEKNSLYCELTALYWAWKNMNVDIIGISHYRRYFSIDKKTPLNLKELQEKYKDGEIIIPKKKRYIESIADHYINCIKSRREAHKIQLKLLSEVILDLEPNYFETYEKHMNSHSSHMLNMYIANKTISDAYCAWLFPILFELEGRIRKENVMYDRIMGSFSEFLLDVWINYNGIKFEELDIYETEKSLPDKIKWALDRRFKK